MKIKFNMKIQHKCAATNTEQIVLIHLKHSLIQSGASTHTRCIGHPSYRISSAQEFKNVSSSFYI